jgi:hypothetical protein
MDGTGHAHRPNKVFFTGTSVIIKESPYRVLKYGLSRECLWEGRCSIGLFVTHDVLFHTVPYPGS